MTRTNRIERMFNAFVLTTLALYVMSFLHETAGQYLV